MVCSNDRFEIALRPFITFPRIIMVVCLKGFRKQFEIRTKYLLVSIANFIMRKGTSMSTVRFVNWGAVDGTLELSIHRFSLSRRCPPEFGLIIRIEAMYLYVLILATCTGIPTPVLMVSK